MAIPAQPKNRRNILKAIIDALKAMPGVKGVFDRKMAWAKIDCGWPAFCVYSAPSRTTLPTVSMTKEDHFFNVEIVGYTDACEVFELEDWIELVMWTLTAEENADKFRPTFSIEGFDPEIVSAAEEGGISSILIVAQTNYAEK